MASILFEEKFPITKQISIRIPTVGEVLKNEDDYYSIVQLLTAMPIDMLVYLDDLSKKNKDSDFDYFSISEYELFLFLSETIKQYDTSLVFDGIDFNKFDLTVDPKTGSPILCDESSGVIIDREIHWRIAGVVRRVNHLKKNQRRPANKEARDYMIERARIKMKRAQKRSVNNPFSSELEDLIVAMVNAEQYKFSFEETKNLTIYQFNQCLHQVVRKNDYNNTMHGVYAGTIDAKKLNQKEFNWLTSK